VGIFIRNLLSLFKMNQAKRLTWDPKYKNSDEDSYERELYTHPQ
jgi:hypothetical protein